MRHYRPPFGYYLSEHTAELTGWPGHRTRPGRSGLDYLESEYEWAHIQGVLYRQLFTLKFRTSDPLHLLLMLLFGFITTFPLALSFAEMFFGNWQIGLGILLVDFIGIYPILGVVVLINLVINLVTPPQAEDGVEPLDEGE